MSISGRRLSRANTPICPAAPLCPWRILDRSGEPSMLPFRRRNHPWSQRLPVPPRARFGRSEFCGLRPVISGARLAAGRNRPQHCAQGVLARRQCALSEDGGPPHLPHLLGSGLQGHDRKLLRLYRGRVVGAGRRRCTQSKRAIKNLLDLHHPHELGIEPRSREGIRSGALLTKE